MKLSGLKDFNNLLSPIKNLILIRVRKIDQFMLNIVKKSTSFLYKKIPFKLAKKYKRITITYF